MSQSPSTERPPVVVVLGHVDHGKSSLLDYIRKTNIVDREAGGITQHTAAYEVVHATKAGAEKHITFIDTPGHSAFQAQRKRGASLADIAILVVSAEDGVKAQTKEALKAITDSDIPYIVAINKIDLPGADLERTLSSLAENEIYVEGRGGSISYVPISAKKGDGIPELLDLIILMAELQELMGTPATPAEGIIVEAHRDPQRGIAATFIITNGTLTKGQFLATEGAFTPVRGIINSAGKPVDSATFSSPVTILGWNALPATGVIVKAYASKKDAETAAIKPRTVPSTETPSASEETPDTALIPIIIKGDAAGSLDAVAHEVNKLTTETVLFKIISTDVGTISENDIKRAGGDDRTVILGFNVKIDAGVRETAERAGVTILTDSIIYKLTEQLEAIRNKRTPKRMVEEQHGTAKILKCFSAAHHKQVVGGRVEDGVLSNNDIVKILRRGEAIGSGRIIELQHKKQNVREVEMGTEFGTKIDSPIEIAAGDQIVAFTKIEK